jgi:hypothetical protein
MVIGVGLWLSASRLRRTKRVHRKRGLIHAAMPEGWGSWFFQGFVDVTMGTRWVVAVLVLAFWVFLGIGLLCMGLCIARQQRVAKWPSDQVIEHRLGRLAT